MRKIIISLIFSILVLLLIACQGEQKAETKVEEEVTTAAVSDTAQVTCPACGMTHAASEMTAYEIEGETHYFCSEACKEHYLADLESPEEEESPEDE